MGKLTSKWPCSSSLQLLDLLVYQCVTHQYATYPHEIPMNFPSGVNGINQDTERWLGSTVLGYEKRWAAWNATVFDDVGVSENG